MSTSVASVVSHFPSPQNGFTTTLASTIASGAATVPLNSVAGYTNGQIAVFVVDPTDPTKKQTFTGVIDTAGVQVTSVVWTAGTNTIHTGGATVVDYATATHLAMISKGLQVAHNQDGTHKSGAVYLLPIIASFVNATHTHANAAGGGQLTGSAITTGSQLADILKNPYKFSAYMAGAANTGNNAFAAIAFDTELFDTGNNHSAGVFTAPIAGFYQFNWNAEATLSAGASETFVTALYKNGAVLKRGSLLTHPGTAASTLQGSHGSALVQLAASDTVSVEASAPAVRALNVSSSDRTWWDGYLVSAT